MLYDEEEEESQLLPYRIILVRHGETSWNQERRFLGHSNPGLNEQGEIQARAVAQRLMAERIDKVFSSDMLRALETSQEIASLHNLPVRITPCLREINFGAWEGLTFAEIQTQYPELLNKWILDPFGVRIPGGETAEEVKSRVMEALDSIVLNTSDKETVVIVAHGGPLRMLLCQLTGVDSSCQWEFSIAHGEKVDLRRNGDIYLIMDKQN